ncbi:hypothetical protein CTI14_32665 [Methylobacterium radiotolerans]|nr:hypothetical protein CTI14_32665 [Methylobacterium radiotolerans]
MRQGSRVKSVWLSARALRTLRAARWRAWNSSESRGERLGMSLFCPAGCPG